MLNKLIEEGELAKRQNTQEGSFGLPIISGEVFETWIAKSLIYMETHHQGSFILERFKEASKKVDVDSTGSYDRMMGILKAIRDMQ